MTNPAARFYNSVGKVIAEPQPMSIEIRVSARRLILHAFFALLLIAAGCLLVAIAAAPGPHHADPMFAGAGLFAVVFFGGGASWFALNLARGKVRGLLLTPDGFSFPTRVGARRRTLRWSQVDAFGISEVSRTRLVGFTIRSRPNSDSSGGANAEINEVAYLPNYLDAANEDLIATMAAWQAQFTPPQPAEG